MSAPDSLPVVAVVAVDCQAGERLAGWHRDPRVSAIRHGATAYRPRYDGSGLADRVFVTGVQATDLFPFRVSVEIKWSGAPAGEYEPAGDLLWPPD